MSISLKKLLADFVNPDELPDLMIHHLTADSREVKPGSLFFAYPGHKTDGRHYLKQAHHQGVKVIVCEKVGLEIYHELLQGLHADVLIIPLHGVQSKLSEIAARFYDYPSRAMTVIGVTGTNGKTSCTHFIAEVLNTLGTRTAVMGTLGYGIPPDLKESLHTTQDAISIQRNLAEFRDQGIQVVAMEVSSHGLAQHRVDAVEFAIAAFTQLSQDHLDYHVTFEDYAAAKERLFHFASLKHVVLNLDDPMGYRLAETFVETIHELSPIDELSPIHDLSSIHELPLCMGYTQERKELKNLDIISAEEIQFEVNGFKLSLNTPWGNGIVHSPLLGRFNISNLLLVLAVVGLLKPNLTETLVRLEKLHSVPGRLQQFGGQGLPEVIVDYAHTPDALEKVLMTLREHCRAKLWCVFGCGGDRDRGKRPLMGAIAERLSDRVVLTDDNPRSEDSVQILKEIQEGLSGDKPIELVNDRALAIKYAIQNASRDDMILIAGKGHEEYQIIGSERRYFSDREQVEAELKNKLSS